MKLTHYPASTLNIRIKPVDQRISYTRIPPRSSGATATIVGGVGFQIKQTQAHREQPLPNRDKNPFHAQSSQSPCATVQRIGAPYLQTSRKTMHRPNDRYSVDGGTAATLLGADHMRQSRRPDRSRRIYFRSPWYRAIGVA